MSPAGSRWFQPSGDRSGEAGRPLHRRTHVAGLDQAQPARSLPTGRLTEARILGVRVDCLDMRTALERVERFVEDGVTQLVATVNAEFVMRAQEDREFARVLNSAGLCLPDGIGVVWAARRQGCALDQTVSGVDLIQPLAAMCARRGFKLFLLGAAPG
ncbi:MAG: hypothetical protein E6I06_11510, partial [Chloroflexi bacterium]